MTVGPIKQRLITGVPVQGVIQPGQLFVDEAAQTLWTAGLSQPLAIPLGRQAFPDQSGVASEVLIQTVDGLAYGVLSAGGGGQPQATSDWLVPGVAPRAIESLLVNASHQFLIELTLPATISAVSMTGGPAAINILTMADDLLRVGSTAAFTPIALSAGTYKVFVEVTTPTTFTALVGNLRNRPEAFCPVFFKIEVG